MPISYLGGALIMLGTVNFMDGLYSILLYWGKPSWRGAQAQTWKKDHWVRAVRMLISVVVIGIGWYLL